MPLPVTTSAALVITGVMFINSHGHGIIAYNVTGKFIMDRVKITQDMQKSGYTILYWWDDINFVTGVWKNKYICNLRILN